MTIQPNEDLEPASCAAGDPCAGPAPLRDETGTPAPASASQTVDVVSRATVCEADGSGSRVAGDSMRPASWRGHDTAMGTPDGADVPAAISADVRGSGSTLRDLHAIPDRVMSGIHAYAYEFYQQGRLDEAEAFFRFLCLYDFYNADYAMGLAAVFQLQGRHRQAIDLYGVAMRLGFSDPSPVFHAGQCFLKLGEIEDARECFAYVTSEAGDASLQRRAHAYLESLGGAPVREGEGAGAGAGAGEDVGPVAEHMEHIDD